MSVSRAAPGCVMSLIDTAVKKTRHVGKVCGAKALPQLLNGSVLRGACSLTLGHGSTCQWRRPPTKGALSCPQASIGHTLATCLPLNRAIAL